MDNLSNSRFNELSGLIVCELNNLPIERDITYAHGSAINGLARTDSDIDIVVISENCKGHRRYCRTTSGGKVFDINLFHPGFMLQAMVAQQRRGMRMLAGMIVDGVVVERNKEHIQLLDQAREIYHGTPGEFNWKLYSDKLFSLFKKISANKGDPINYVMIAEVYSLVATAYLWTNSQWVRNGKFLMEALKKYDHQYYFRLTEAYKADLSFLDCMNMNFLASEIFSDFGGLGNCSYESSFFE